MALFAMGVVYLLSLRAYSAGFFNDDAFFIIGSQSLLEGHYVELNQPGEPPLVNYMPGYPLLLAPLTLFSPHDFLPHQLLSVALTLGTLLLIWLALKKKESTPVLAGTLLLTALNPLTVSLSGTILSDVPYLFFSLLFLYLTKENWNRRTGKTWVGLSLLAAFTVYLRPIGAALCLGLVGVLFIDGRKKLGMMCGAIILGALAPFFIRNMMVRGFGFWYGVEYMDQYRQLGFLPALLPTIKWQIPYYVHELFIRTFFRWPVSQWDPINSLTILGSLIFLGVGITGSQGKKDRFPLLIAAYLILYAVVHLSWHRQAGRYLLPILPFIYYFFFKGAEKIDTRFKPRLRLVWVSLFLSVALLSLPLKAIVRASLSGTGFSVPQATYQWIQKNTPEQAIFANELDGQLYLLTGRQSFHFQKGLTPPQFKLWLQQKGIQYVLVTRTNKILKTQAGNTQHDPTAQNYLTNILEEETFFKRVFEDKKEGTSVWKRTHLRQGYGG